MSVLSGKRVLITGASGFIPSHLVRRLVGEGADVAATVKYNSVIDNVRLMDLWDRIHVLEADLRNQDSLKQVAEYRPQIVYHMAAYNHVGDSFTHFSEALQSNAIGTANIMEAYDGYERFVYISTSEVYGLQQEVPFVETMTPSPISPYAIGKYSGELYARMKSIWNERRVVVVRPFNAYGPYQSPRAVIAEVIMDCLAGKTVRATEGKQTRDFNFVENLVDGLVLAGELEEAVGQVINLGSGHEITIRELIETIHKLTGKRSELEFGALANRPTEIWRMVADSRRAKALLGWEPKICLEDGLSRTVEWYRAYLEAFSNPSGPLHALSAS